MILLLITTIIFIIIVIIIRLIAPTLPLLIWLVIFGLFVFFIYEYYSNNHIENNQTCIKTGCSGQICSSEPKISTCEWRCEYDCYRNALCKKINGQCQWEIDDKIKDCLKKCN